jgi:hypothetical protein
MVCRVGSKIIAAVFLAGWIALSDAAPAQPVISKEFDCATTHRFDGFGLNIWALAGREPPLLGLFDELRVKWVRWNMPPDVEKVDIPEAATFDELVDWLDRLAPAQPLAERGFQLFSRLHALGIAQIAVSFRVPIKWRNMANQGKSGVAPIDDRHIDDYARLLTARLVLLRRHGIHPDGIELLNEPANKISPQQYGRLIKSFRAWADRSGSHAIRVVGAGTVFTWDNRPFLEAVVREGSTIDIVSTHAYDTLKTHELTSLAPLFASNPWSLRRPIFVTEYGIDAGLWYHAPEAVEGVPYAVRAAGQTLALLGSGANAVFYWQAQDPPWEKPPLWGLLSLEDKRRPAIDAVKQIIRPLALGDHIVSSIPTEAASPAMAVVQPSRLMLELANPSGENRHYDISFRNCTAGPIAVSAIESWPAERNVSIRSLPGMALEVNLPANTVATIAITR